MAEKRKPVLTLLLKKQGKKSPCPKVELFKANEWDMIKNNTYSDTYARYRIRVNGKWYKPDNNKKAIFTKSEFRDIFWNSIKELF